MIEVAELQDDNSFYIVVNPEGMKGKVIPSYYILYAARHTPAVTPGALMSWDHVPVGYHPTAGAPDVDEYPYTDDGKDCDILFLGQLWERRGPHLVHRRA